MKRRPPQWYQFGWWVVAGALVGLGIAFGLFCVVHFLLYGNFAFIKHMQALAGATDVKPADIFSMTATALGGFTIGGVAVMQYRKHKWAEYQAKMDEDSRTGERLGKAIEHLSEEQKLHTRLGAIYELERLAEDSYRDQLRIADILTCFISTKFPEDETLEDKELEKWLDVDRAMRIASNIARIAVENAKCSRKDRKHWRTLPSWVYLITQMTSKVKYEGNSTALCWDLLKASKLNLDGMQLKNAQFYGADFRKSILTGVLFNDSYLELADFSGADLFCTDFRGANLENAKFKKAKNMRYAKIDGNTRFSPGVRMKYFGVEEPEHRGN